MRLSVDERLLAGTYWQETGMIFTSYIGALLEPRNVNRQFDRFVEKAQLLHIRFHDLRHTCATLLLVQGVPPRVVMDLLGHSKIAVRWTPTRMFYQNYTARRRIRWTPY